MLETELYFVKNLRQASPYISQHRGKLVVFYLPGEMINDGKKLLQLAEDLVLLNNLGLKIILTLGATLQINQKLAENNINWDTYQNIRITSKEQIQAIQETVGLVRSKLESVFSQASAEQHLPHSVVSGNWLSAKPKGIIDGTDYKYTGSLRQINTNAINKNLEANQICLLTPLAYSASGEVFNLNTLEQAYSIADKLSADKLMIFTEESHLKILPKSLDIVELKKQIQHQHPNSLLNLLEKSLASSKSIKRIHLMSQNSPSSILLELFTREGTGTLIYTDRYHHLRTANSDDLIQILKLIQPLEEQGILANRNEKEVIQNLPNFIVAEIDGQIIGCAAIYSLDSNIAELACLAVNPTFQGDEIGKQLVSKTSQLAKERHHNQIFILTTQTNHWFKEQGFQDSDYFSLPVKRQETYNQNRKSKILIKNI